MCCTLIVTDVRVVSVYPIFLPVRWVSSWVSCFVFTLKFQKLGVVFVGFVC